jgi:hypothetical protein
MKGDDRISAPVTRFGLLECPHKGALEWTWGTLHLRLRRKASTFLLERLQADGSDQTLLQVAFAKPPPGLRFLPALPLLPAWLKFPAGTVLLAEQPMSLRFFVPLLLQVHDPQSGRTLLELEACPWPRAWGGDSPMAGELCLFIDELAIGESLQRASTTMDEALMLCQAELHWNGGQAKALHSLRLPVQQFPLYREADRGFFCEPLWVEWDDSGVPLVREHRPAGMDRSLWVRMAEGRQAMSRVARAFAPLVDVWGRMS